MNHNLPLREKGWAREGVGNTAPCLHLLQVEMGFVSPVWGPGRVTLQVGRGLLVSSLCLCSHQSAPTLGGEWGKGGQAHSTFSRSSSIHSFSSLSSQSSPHSFRGAVPSLSLEGDQGARTKLTVVWLAGGSPSLPLNVSRQGRDQGWGCLCR